MVVRRWRVLPALVVIALAVVCILADASLVSAQPQIGQNSCQGEDACTGLTARVGDGSCNGVRACFNNSGNVGDGSCNGDYACALNSDTVGDGSCISDGAC